MDGSSKSMNETLKYFFESKKGADVVFVIHGKEFEAHKFIVTSRSPVFEAMMNNDLAPKDCKHLINDPKITYEDFVIFLKFLYTDEFQLITQDNVEQLLYLSDFYNVKYLSDQCIEYIIKTLNNKNILKYAELGLVYADTCSLLEICISKLPSYLSNFSLTYATQEDKNKWISQQLIIKIAEKCPRTGFVNEDLLFKKIFEWAKNFNNASQENLKVTFNPLIPFIRFEQLKPLTLSTTVKENNLLDDSTLLDALSKAVIKSNAKEEENKIVFTNRQFFNPMQMQMPPTVPMHNKFNLM